MKPVSPSLRALLLCGLLSLGLLGTAQAHKGSDAYLDIRQTDAGPGAAVDPAASIQTRFLLAVAIKDLDLLVPIDANADANVTWGEVKAAMPQVLALLDRSATTAPCAINWSSDGLERRSDGVYIRLAAQSLCPGNQALAFSYSLLKDQDATHRLLVTGRVAGQDLLTTLSPLQKAPLLLGGANVSGRGADQGADATGTAADGVAANRWAALRDYFLLGAHHLLEGYDHLAFLLALVLPLQLLLLPRARGIPVRAPSANTDHRQAAQAWAAATPAAGASVWLSLLRTVTAFTIGHSITLVLATLGLTQASPSWVEPVIALSIAATAWLNLRPVAWVRTDVLALLFGLVHGFGFAGLLLEAAAPSGLLPWALFGFNLGVEAGQLLAVLAWVALSQALVGRSWYQAVVVRGGSALLIALGLWWFWARI
ncbi:HupE/UreJ family protein [Hydrogenophaga sp.]|uniref:HupE/UreJ family protein n=1 Tax=Hydrogenophaga sp. TaxID=1904254 RepID=UPI00356A3B11